jgi:hypothetical protein
VVGFTVGIGVDGRRMCPNIWKDGIRLGIGCGAEMKIFAHKPYFGYYVTKSDKIIMFFFLIGVFFACQRTINF